MRIGRVVAIGVAGVGVALVVLDILARGIGLEAVQFLLTYILMAGGIDLLDKGLRAGWVLLPHGKLDRETHPVAFWCFVVLYMLLLPALTLAAMGMQAEALF